MFLRKLRLVALAAWFSFGWLIIAVGLLTLISYAGHSFRNPKPPVLLFGWTGFPIPSVWLFEILAHLSVLSLVMWAEEQIGNRFKDQVHAFWPNADPIRLDLIAWCHGITVITVATALLVLGADFFFDDFDPRSRFVHVGLFVVAVLVVLQRMVTWSFHIPYKAQVRTVTIGGHAPANELRARGFNNIHPE